VLLAGIGETLRSNRERKGLSIDQVAQDTRISPRFLEALEDEQFNELPAPVYVRGFLRSYANYLRIDPQPLLERLIGGENGLAAAPEGYVGAQRAGNGQRKVDPFQRGGVVAAPPLPRQPEQPPYAPDDESWEPEALAPIAPPAHSNGYVPGSDLMESPEYLDYDDDYPPEEEPRFRPRNVGVLAERPPGPNDPNRNRVLAMFAGGAFILLGALAFAVFATGGDDDDDDGNNAANGDGNTPAITPGSVIPVGSVTPGASASASPAASASASASPSGTVTATTTPATATPSPTPGAGTPTATPTPTLVPTIQPTAAPTATPTLFVPTATPIPIRNEARTFAECTPDDGSYDCGAPPYRVICYAPLGYPQNSNWWVDVDRSFGAVPAGWKEFDGLQTIGQIINAGQSLCATP